MGTTNAEEMIKWLEVEKEKMEKDGLIPTVEELIERIKDNL